MDMQPQTRITLAYELAAHLGRHRETIGLRLKGISTDGLAGFLVRHAQAKKGDPTSPSGPRDDQATDLRVTDTRARVLWPEDRPFPGTKAPAPALRAEDL